MVDPFNITKYDRSTEELEEMLLFCVLVAGKPARRTATQLARFLDGDRRPFTKVRRHLKDGTLLKSLKENGFGQYDRITKCFKELTGKKLDLRSCTADELDAIHGIGPKTAAFFITHSRPPVSPDIDEVILDTHNMKHIAKNADWLVERGLITAIDVEKMPRNTPSSRKSYKRYAECFRALLKRDEPNGSMASYDLKVWKSYARAS